MIIAVPCIFLRFFCSRKPIGWSANAKI